MKLPRVQCPDCKRGIAAGPVAGRLTKGRIWRHDPPNQRREPGRPLISCDGSLEIVDLPLPGRQMEFDIPDADTPAAEEDAEEMALF
jgi:hypothetical protein